MLWMLEGARFRIWREETGQAWLQDPVVLSGTFWGLSAVESIEFGWSILDCYEPIVHSSTTQGVNGFTRKPVLYVRYCDGFKRVNMVSLQLRKSLCPRVGDPYKEDNGQVA